MVHRRVRRTGRQKSGVHIRIGFRIGMSFGVRTSFSKSESMSMSMSTIRVTHGVPNVVSWQALRLALP